ncbi:MAG: DUF2207 domain-containing protein [Bacteroidales bacterium]|nr:DUF2207 domain-containing protein [Bacteroidales bacterium]
MKRIALALCAVLLGTCLDAQRIRDIDIDVVVGRDGSAVVTQNWDVDVTRGTEWYIPVGNLGPMTVSSLEVSEGGVAFESVGNNWNVDWSRSRKMGKCGIVRKDNGFELCWGLGEYGRHHWTARFVLTGLVQGYDDADAFNFMFVNPGLEPSPEHVKLRVTPGFDCPEWTYDNTRVWAFGFNGEINVSGGAVVAESTESFGYHSKLIALVKFSKGIFEPAVVKGGPAEDLIDRALDGSAYSEEDDDFPMAIGIIMLLLFGGFLGMVIWIAVASALGLKWKKSLFGKKKIEGWFREIPLEGNLFAAEYLLVKGPRFSAAAPAQNIIGAMFLRWIMDGAVKVQPDPSSSKRVNLLFTTESVSADDVEEDLFRYARTAAGSNLLLEKNEFENWSKKNYRKMTAWPDRAVARGKSWFYGKGYFLRNGVCSLDGQKEACHLIEFKNFLKDFTISDQREAVEVQLWKDYLVYAQLFGIADKVAKQFKKLYPAEFTAVEESTGLDPGSLYRTILWTNNLSARSFNTAVARAGNIDGTGGRSSFGGGGGFSGGGFGGGAR